MPVYVVKLLVTEQDEYIARSLVEFIIEHAPLSGEDKKRVKFKGISEAPAPKPSLYECLICGEVFDTRTGKGKMHMSGHGLNLYGALKTGKAKRIEE